MTSSADAPTQATLRVEPDDNQTAELFFAVVQPIGVPDQKFHARLAAALASYGYTTESIKISELLADRLIESGKLNRNTPANERTDILMTAGNEFCQQNDSPAALAALAVGEIRRRRGKSAHRTAYIIDSLKRPSEVEVLRDAYGDHLHVFGLQAAPAARKSELFNKYHPDQTTMGEQQIRELADRLIDRDLQEADNAFGQNVLRTFPKADTFVDVTHRTGRQVRRVIDLIFGNPEQPTPTWAEYAMSLAHISSTRSAELGLKVGAAISRGKSIISCGANTHPLHDDAPAYDSSQVDVHGLVGNLLQSLGDALSPEMASQLDDNPENCVAALLAGKLKDSKVRDLIEFQKPVHAEMNALLNALRLGRPVENAEIYVTAYPCHACTKHLLALNIVTYYLEPYPKSRAEVMYGSAARKSIHPFTGIAPRRFESLFRVRGDRKGPNAARLVWSLSERLTASPKLDNRINSAELSRREVAVVVAHCSNER